MKILKRYEINSALGEDEDDIDFENLPLTLNIETTVENNYIKVCLINSDNSNRREIFTRVLNEEESKDPDYTAHKVTTEIKNKLLPICLNFDKEIKRQLKQLKFKN